MGGLFTSQEIQKAGGVNQSAPPVTPAPLASNGALFSPDEINGQPDTPIGNQPASLSGVIQTLKPGNGGITAAVKGATTDLLQGIGEGALDTVHGVGTLINKAGNAIKPGLGDTIVPPTGSNALQQIAAPDKGTAQQVGKSAEDIAEFVSGDEALKGLSLSERALKAANLADKYEKASGFTKAAMDAVFNGARQGTVTAGETLGKTGDVGQAAEAGATGAVAGTALSAAGKGIGAIRDIYRPLETAEAVQPVIQGAIRDTATKVAADAGVTAPTSKSVRDVVADLAENVKAKSQPIFQQLDDLTGGKFSDAQADAQRYRGSVDKAGKDAYAEAIQTQEDLFNSVKGKMDPDALNQAKADWKRFNALSDVADAVQKSTSGQRPEIAALSSASQPAETVNAKALLGKLNGLYNDGTLQTAFGNQAHAILDHAGASTAKLQAITDALNAQKSAKRTVNYVSKRAAVGTAELVGGGAILKAAGVFGGKK